MDLIPEQYHYKLEKKVDFEHEVDLHLEEIANVLDNWEDVAPLLGLTNIQTNDIQETHRYHPDRQRLVILLH